MKARTLAVTGVAGALVVGAVVLAVKYDDWFITPKRIAENRGYVVQQMRDPTTVQYRGERLTARGWLCGELNGKNAYGAYVGFKRFMSRSYDDAWIDGSGYVGKKEGRSTEQVISALSEQNAAIRKIRTEREKSPELKPLASEELESMAELEVFNQRWKQHCT